jgi:hypothetical protein
MQKFSLFVKKFYEKTNFFYENFNLILDIDECLENSEACRRENCVNLIGSFLCNNEAVGCPKGYAGHQAKKNNSRYKFEIKIIFFFLKKFQFLFFTFFV